MAISVSRVAAFASTSTVATIGRTVTAAIGDMVIMVVASSNDGSGGASAYSSIADTALNTWSTPQNINYDPGAAGAGATLVMSYTIVTNTMTAAGVTMTFSPSTDQKVAMCYVITKAASENLEIIVTGSGSGQSTASPTVTTASLVSGELVIGYCAIETDDGVTIDADSTNGSWSSEGGTVADGGADASCMTLTTQYKIVTGTGTQTYNPTVTSGTSRDMAYSYVTIRAVVATITGTATPSTDAATLSAASTLALTGNVTQTTTGVLLSTETVGWTPANIVGADIIGWWDAADSTTLTFSGSNLLYWRDKSGEGNHFNRSPQQAAGATATTVNGRVSLLFNDSGMKTAATFAFTDFTVFAVFTPSSTHVSHERIIESDYVDSWWVGRDALTQAWGGGFAETVAPYGRYVSLADSTCQQVSVKRSGTTHTVRGNGGAVSTSATVSGATSGTQELTLGDDIGGLAAVTGGIISEVLVYNQVLSTDDEFKVEGYLAWKWGIQASLPSGHPYELAPPSDVPTGVLSKTIDTFTASSTSTLTLSGNVSQSTAAFTLSGVANVSGPNAAFSQTIGTVTGSLVGNLYINAVSTKTIDTITFSGVGNLAINAVSVPTTAAFTLSGISNVSGPVGNVTQTIGAATLSGLSTLSINAVSSKTIDTITVSGVGNLAINAVSSTSTAAFTLLAEGNSSIPAIVGTSTTTIDTVTVSSASTLSINAVSTATMAAFTTTSAATLSGPVASLSQSIGAVAGSLVGNLYINAVSSSTLDTITLTGVIRELIVGLDSTIDDVTGTLTGTLALKGNVTVTVASTTLVSTSTLALRATSTKTLDAVTAVSASTLALRATSTPTMAAFTTSSTASLPIVAAVASTIGTVTATSASRLQLSGTMSATLSDVSGALDADLPVVGTLPGTLVAVGLSATAVLAITGTVSKTIDVVSFSSAGAGTGTVYADASMIIGDVVVTTHGFSPEVIERLIARGRANNVVFPLGKRNVTMPFGSTRRNK